MHMTMDDDFFIDDEGFVVVADAQHGHSVRVKKATSDDMHTYQLRLDMLRQQQEIADTPIKSHILDYVSDTVADLLYYDRKECEVLKVGDIEKAIRDGLITVDEMAEKFKEHLIKAVEEE